MPLASFGNLISLIVQWRKEKNESRNKAITLIKKVSQELEALAAYWRGIYLELEHEKRKAVVRQKLHDQKENFESLKVFCERIQNGGVQNPDALNDVDQYTLKKIEGVLKKNICIHKIVADFLGSGSKLIITSCNTTAAEVDGLSSDQHNEEKIGKDLLKNLRKEVDDLSSVSGEFRMMVSILESE